MKNKKAFTLIEIVVVVGIIGIISTLAVVSLKQSRSKARDVKRLADMKQVQASLELFFYENDRYPTEEEWEDGSLISVPTAPTPPDGECSEGDNAYMYKPNDDLDFYEVSFCTGKQMQDIQSGYLCADPDGFVKNCTLAMPDPCGGETSIFYEGRNYELVSIGSQCWFAENLNIGNAILNNETPSINPPEKYCYGASETEADPDGNCNIFGGLYLWEVAMGGSTEEGAQGICPPGWHIPSEEDVSDLKSYLGSRSAYICDNNPNSVAVAIAGNQYWNYSSTRCTPGYDLSENNKAGMNLLPGGLRLHTRSYSNLYNVATFWSSVRGYLVRTSYVNSPVYYQRESGYSDYYALPVRCLKN